jgi:hypothetical protein
MEPLAQELMMIVRQNMTRERAEFVKRRYQYTEGCTWRVLTWVCWEAWREPAWIVPGNQLWGQALLEVAGEVLEENPHAWPLKGLDDDLPPAPA